MNPTGSAPAPTPAPEADAATPARFTPRATSTRQRKDRVFVAICVTAAVVAVAVLVTLLASILLEGLGWLNLSFLTGLADPDPAKSGILPALVGSIYICLITAATAIPIGVGTAVLLEEFKPRSPLLQKLLGLVQLNISNLAGVPSIVYGILGVTAFANLFGLAGTPGANNLAIGQTWFLRYTDGAKQSYYTPADGPEAELTPLSKDIPLWLDTEQTRPAEGLEFLTPEETRPRIDAVRTEMRAFDRTLRDGIQALQTGERNRGPVVIDEAAATTVIDTAIAAGTFRIDIDAMRPDLIAMAMALDGLESRELRKKRSAILDRVIDTERDHRLAGVMTLGAEPTRIDRRAWYFLALPFGRSILAGGLTLMLVILPVIIIASQESLRAVPDSMRQGALALGGTRWQSVAKIALPAAIPGICTGTILAMSRAIGEAAPLLVLAGVVFISFTPANLMDNFTVMPLQIFNWASRPQPAFHHVAAAGIIVLLAVLLTFNAFAVLIRQKTSRRN